MNNLEEIREKLRESVTSIGADATADALTQLLNEINREEKEEKERAKKDAERLAKKRAHDNAMAPYKKIIEDWYGINIDDYGADEEVVIALFIVALDEVLRDKDGNPTLTERDIMSHEGLVKNVYKFLVENSDDASRSLWINWASGLTKNF